MLFSYRDLRHYYDLYITFLANFVKKNWLEIFRSHIVQYNYFTFIKTTASRRHRFGFWNIFYNDVISDVINKYTTSSFAQDWPYSQTGTSFPWLQEVSRWCDHRGRNTKICIPNCLIYTTEWLSHITFYSRVHVKQRIWKRTLSDWRAYNVRQLKKDIIISTFLAETFSLIHWLEHFKTTIHETLTMLKSVY